MIQTFSDFRIEKLRNRYGSGRDAENLVFPLKLDGHRLRASSEAERRFDLQPVFLTVFRN